MKIKLSLLLAEIAILIFCLSCKDDNEQKPIGCFTGERNGKRELLECSVEKDYRQVTSSLPEWPNHNKYKWEPAKNCQECYDKYN
jgi:hypothetical protein